MFRSQHFPCSKLARCSQLPRVLLEEEKKFPHVINPSKEAYKGFYKTKKIFAIVDYFPSSKFLQLALKKSTTSHIVTTVLKAHLIFERERLRHIPRKAVDDDSTGVRQLHDLLLDLRDGRLLPGQKEKSDSSATTLLGLSSVFSKILQSFSM